MRSMIFGMKGPEDHLPHSCSTRAWISHPMDPGTKVQNYGTMENGSYSFNQPVCYCYKRMAGIIEHLDIIQCF